MNGTRSTVFAVASLATSVAGAATYGTADGGCNLRSGDGPISDLSLLYDGASLEGYGWGCDLAPATDNQLAGECVAEGMPYSASFEVFYAAPGDTDTDRIVITTPHSTWSEAEGRVTDPRLPIEAWILERCDK
ncbi:MAG: hypothetical protein GY798_33635 [Hyphomicrobiales bacterium]|nr:hypothetical protein [Hyphomicrobiales bacterium]